VARKVHAKYELFGNSVLTYFRKGKLEKFYLSNANESLELDFLSAVRLFEASLKTKAHSLPGDFYDYLAQNKSKMDIDLNDEPIEKDTSNRGGRDNAIRILKILRSMEIRQYSSFTDLDDEYLEKVRKLLEDGALPKTISKKIFMEINGQTNPMKVLAGIKRHLPNQFFNSTQTAKDISVGRPKEVILSEYIIK